MFGTEHFVLISTRKLGLRMNMFSKRVAVRMELLWPLFIRSKIGRARGMNRVVEGIVGEDRRPVDE